MRCLLFCIASNVGIKAGPATTLKRLIDHLSSAVFNRVVRPSGLSAISGWSSSKWRQQWSPEQIADWLYQSQPVSFFVHRAGRHPA